MRLVRWDPFRDLLRLSDPFPMLSRSDAPLDRAGLPAVDVFERGDDLVLRAEFPGVERDDIDVRVEDHTLTLHAERKREADFEDKNAFIRERTYGVLTRRFDLPETVDASRIDASFKNGVLEVTLPKADEAKPRKIEIAAA